VFTGPSATYRTTGVLNARDRVRILERNAIGNWVHVWQVDDANTPLLDGWMMTGYLNLHPDLHLSRLPVNTRVPDADAAEFSGQEIAPLYAAPVIPHISPAMREIYLKGIALGNPGNAITKVGDSVSANLIYLSPMSLGNQELGPYDYLDDTIRHFGASVAIESIAAQKGLSSYGVFDPLNNERECYVNESPLVCEYRIKQPSVAFIMFGPNDIWFMDAAEFEVQMRQIVDLTLTRGIIPVLSTFSADPRQKSWELSIDFNVVIVKVARDYDIPVMNLWLAARDLPGYGLGHPHEELWLQPD
jgi:hypothetical protein